MIRRKYKKEDQELAISLLNIGRSTVILEIKLLGTSKVVDNLIYDCKYLDNGTIKEVSIIAHDVTQALAKLNQYVNSGIPANILKIMLGSERYNN